MRNLPQSVKDALAKDSVVLVALVSLQLQSPVYAAIGHRDIEHAGTLYRTDAGLEKIPDITSEFALSASTISLNFYDDTYELTTQAVNHDVFGSQLDIHIAVLNAEDDSVLHVIESVYRGYLENPVPGTGSIKFEFKNHLAKLERVAGRRTNSESQSLFFPDDIGFDIISGNKV